MIEFSLQKKDLAASHDLVVPIRALVPTFKFKRRVMIAFSIAGTKLGGRNFVPRGTKFRHLRLTMPRQGQAHPELNRSGLGKRLGRSSFGANPVRALVPFGRSKQRNAPERDRKSTR